MAENAKELFDRIHTIKGGATNEIVAERNKATVAGAVVGSMFGIYYGYSRSKNLLITGIFGAILGAVSIRLMMPKDK